jgi:hypothetical protein
MKVALAIVTLLALALLSHTMAGAPSDLLTSGGVTATIR